jgi:cytochrome P450
LFQIVVCLIGALWFCGYCVGNKVFYNLGPDLIIMVTNPNLVKQILLDIGNYHKARPSTFVLSKLVGKSILTMNGEKWVNHRQMFAHVFHVEVRKVLSIPNH